MKKFLFVIGGLLVLVIFSTIGYQVVSANEMVDEVKNLIDIQNGVDDYFSSYGYTIDNPCIILNPYNISPLTALILFDTDEEASITVRIEGKDRDTTIENTFNKSKKHMIPIYGLYANYDNKVTLSYKNIKKEYVIKTGSLPKDLKVEKIDFNNQFVFLNDGNYSYAIDKNQDVRWYLTENYYGKIERMDNGHFLLGGNNFFTNGYSKNLLEIDLLGKIYYQYNIEDGYYGTYTEVGSRLFVLSNNLLEIDKQSGVVVSTIQLDRKYTSISYDEKNNSLELVGEKSISINLNTLEIIDTSFNKDISGKNFISNLYINHEEYKIFKGVKFSNLQKTKESSKKIFLVGYKKIDDNYLKYHIEFNKSEDYFQIKGNFDKNDHVYVILDKFLNKKVYDMDGNQLIINSTYLNGKYSIYIQINDIIYQTNHYVVF